VRYCTEDPNNNTDTARCSCARARVKLEGIPKSGVAQHTPKSRTPSVKLKGYRRTMRHCHGPAHYCTEDQNRTVGTACPHHGYTWHAPTTHSLIHLDMAGACHTYLDADGSALLHRKAYAHQTILSSEHEVKEHSISIPSKGGICRHTGRRNTVESESRRLVGACCKCVIEIVRCEYKLSHPLHLLKAIIKRRSVHRATSICKPS
jgi:hypothetical protein